MCYNVSPISKHPDHESGSAVSAEASSVHYVTIATIASLRRQGASSLCIVGVWTLRLAVLGLVSPTVVSLSLSLYIYISLVLAATRDAFYQCVTTNRGAGHIRAISIQIRTH